MRKSRFSDEQVVAILRGRIAIQWRSSPKRHGISEQTIYTWRKRFGTFQADDVRRLKLRIPTKSAGDSERRRPRIPIEAGQGFR